MMDAAIMRSRRPYDTSNSIITINHILPPDRYIRGVEPLRRVPGLLFFVPITALDKQRPAAQTWEVVMRLSYCRVRAALGTRSAGLVGLHPPTSPRPTSPRPTSPYFPAFSKITRYNSNTSVLLRKCIRSVTAVGPTR